MGLVVKFYYFFFFVCFVIFWFKLNGWNVYFHDVYNVSGDRMLYTCEVMVIFIFIHNEIFVAQIDFCKKNLF